MIIKPGLSGHYNMFLQPLLHVWQDVPADSFSMIPNAVQYSSVHPGQIRG